MLGIMTENTNVLNGDDRPQKRPKLTEEFSSPQRSILDFFKGSSKSDSSTSKPKDLFGYFTKVSSNPTSKCNGDVSQQKKEEFLNGNVDVAKENTDNINNCKIKKGKKRKHNGESSKDESLEDFEVEKKGETCEKSKIKSKERKKSISTNNKRKKDINIEDKDKRKDQNFENPSDINDDIKKCEINNVDVEDPEVGGQPDVKDSTSDLKGIDSCSESLSSFPEHKTNSKVNQVCNAELKNVSTGAAEVVKDSEDAIGEGFTETEEVKPEDQIISKSPSSKTKEDTNGESTVHLKKKKNKKKRNKKQLDMSVNDECSDLSMNIGEDDESNKESENKMKEKCDKKGKKPGEGKLKDEDKKKEQDYVDKLINKMASLENKAKTKNKLKKKVKTEQSTSEKESNGSEKGNDSVMEGNGNEKGDDSVMESNGSEKRDESVMEVSYSEYMQSLQKDEETAENKSVKINEESSDASLSGDKSKENICENEEIYVPKSEMSYSEFLDSINQGPDEAGVETGDDLNESKGDQIREKKYPSVANFFTKISKDAKRCQNNKEENMKVTVRADIHPIPSPPNSVTKLGTKPKSDRKTSPVIKKHDEIEILGYEIIDIDSEKKKKSKRNNVQKSSKTKESQKCIENSSAEILIESGEEEADMKMKENETNSNKSINLEKSAFLLDTEKPVIPQKTTQMTLSFGKVGIQSQKVSHATRVRKVDKKQVESDVPLSESTPVKPKGKRGRPPKKGGNSERDENDETSDISEVTPIKVSDSDQDKSGVSERRRTLRQKYKVSLLDNDKKGSPIRIRLRRCDKSSSSVDGDAFTPKSTKQREQSKKTNTKLSKAQELLVKAKKSKQHKPKINSRVKNSVSKSDSKEKKKNEKKEEATEKSGRRRSARLEQHRNHSTEEADIVIVDDEEGEDDEEETGKRGRKKKKLTKAKPTPSKMKTPSKARKDTPKKGTPKKLASIFQKGKDKKESKPVIELDPEKEKQRRAFLMSGVPEELKRQTATSGPVVVGDYPPLPTVSHIQQKEISLVEPCRLDIWNLPDVKLQVSDLTYDVSSSRPLGWSEVLIDRSECSSDMQIIQKFTKHKIEDPTHVLKELEQFCPSYPVNKMYKVLKEKVDLYSDDTGDVKTKTENTESKKQEMKEENEKKIKRRSLRLKRKEEDVIIVGSPEPKDEQQMESSTNSADLGLVVPSLPWTEKYQPEHSSEIVGNSSTIKKLKSWLLEWKHRVDKEARKAKMLLMKQKKKEKDIIKEDDWWADDSCDFEMDSDDSEDEDDRLCNTVMLIGPTGIGKTATVYALAQELGYKVFEVNASSSRNGKRILSQLQEATQSHQVSHNKDHKPFGTPSKRSTSGFSLNSKETTEKKLPTSFANMFKKANASNKTAPETTSTFKSSKRKRKDENITEEKTPKKKKMKVEKSKCSQSSETKDTDVAVNKGIKMTSTSLILFEELDIAFEEDRGFWAAVQHFMSTTKIPIILTTDDPTIPCKFEGKFEQYIFKTPSLMSSTIYLQLICLVENVRTDSKEIFELLSVNKGDIRKTLLSLQYLTDSGGGVKQIKRKITMATNSAPAQILSMDENTCSQDSQSSMKNVTSNIHDTPVSLLNGDDDDDDDDFVSIKPARTSARRLISDDENSCSNILPVYKNVDKTTSDSSMSKMLDSTLEPKQDVIQEDNLPLVHKSYLDSSLGFQLGHCESIVQLLSSYLKKNGVKQLPFVAQVYQQYIQLKCNILYNNYLDLLPLPKIEVLEVIKMEKPVQHTKRKRIKQTFDLYDSEASNDASQDEDKNVADMEKEKETKASKDENSVEAKISKEENLLSAQSLSSFTEFYDNLSFTDCLRKVCRDSQDCSEAPSILRTGLSDKVLNIEHANEMSHLDTNSLCAELELNDFKKLCDKQTEIFSKEINDLDHFSIPVLKGSSGSLLDPSSNRPKIEKVTSNVISNLPLNVYCQRRPVTMDYMPVLRTISQTEQIRQQAKAKRRFHHYFDNIGLCLRESTLNVLCQPL